MQLELSMRPALGVDQRMVQKLECTIRLSQKLVDPFRYARKLFVESKKVNVLSGENK